MNELLLIISAVLMLLGIVGCIFPVVPGPPLSFIALVLIHLSGYAEFSTNFLLLFGGLTIAVSLLDYLIPVLGARKFGGSRTGAVGALVGMLVGLFLFPPLGLIGGTLIGSFAGELMAGKNVPAALKASFGSLLGFVAGTVIKVTLSGLMLYYYLRVWL